MTEEELLATFLATLMAAPARVLLLDYDGTLAPFRVERDQATPYPGVREAVQALIRSGRTRVVVVSGRTLEALRPLLGVEPPPELWGTHGWERLQPGEPPRTRQLPAEVAEALAEGARAVATREFRDRVEVKPASVAIHVRGMAPVDAERVLATTRDAWKTLEVPALEVHGFDGGIELRVSGWDKRDAVREVLAQEPRGTAAAYLGDDLTDEAAFGALHHLAELGRISALSALVRSEPRQSAAHLWLRPPEQLLAFLDRWRRAAA